jgi:hypothetical protein
VRCSCEFSEHNIERELCQPPGPKISENPDIWQSYNKYGIIPWCHTEGTLMGDEYTFDDYECVVESYDLGEVLDDQWGDEEYSQADQYAAMADRHYA